VVDICEHQIVIVSQLCVDVTSPLVGLFVRREKLVDTWFLCRRIIIDATEVVCVPSLA
jgi:hypothetical protein